jgi:hypothetical protein
MFIIFLTVVTVLVNSVSGATDTTYSGDFILTYSQMQNAGVGGTIVYDLARRSFGLRFTGQGSSEIYSFNVNLGYGESGQYENQYVWKIAPNSACSPCAQYSNTKGFPFTNDTFSGGWANSVLIPPAIKGRFGSNIAGTVDARGCRRYDAPPTSWASYFGIKGNELCYIADTTGRLFTIIEGSIKPTYDTSILNPPTGCKCLLPVDIAVSLDRSSSIDVKSTYFYNAFMTSFANSFYFNSSDPVNTAQLSITQWGGTFWPLNSIGNLNFTSNYDNIKTAASVMGCTSRSEDCKFCYNCDNKKREQGQGSCSDPKKPSTNSTGCTYGESTCTGCGIRGMADQFTRSTYVNRPSATKLAIVITDGRSNTPSPGNPTYKQGDCVYDSDQNRTRRQNIGCYRDITNAREYLLSKIPGVVTYAIGVGSEYSSTTLDRISGSSGRSFNVTTFEDLLANLQKFVLGFCPLPNPISECGNCCGFCQCGVCVAPDVPIPSSFCDEYEYTLSTGNCYINRVRKVDPPCPPLNCKSASCNNATNTCSYVDNCATGGNPCFEYGCVRNSSTGFYSCQPSLYLCSNTTGSPTAPTTTTPPNNCSLDCGVFGECDVGGTFCNCTDNYTGTLCAIPPGIDVCSTDEDCFVNYCIESECVVGEGGGKVCLSKPKDCEDGDLCTDNFCLDDVGCQITEKSCDDGLLCTEDSCVASTGLCSHQVVNCSHLDDECHTSYCNDFSENVTLRCQKQLVECNHEGNCSIAECRDGEGCVSEQYSCGVAYYGVVAGVTAGVIAGIVAAAFVCIAGAATAGGGYAVSRSYNAESDNHVHVSPLYKSGGKAGVGLS